VTATLKAQATVIATAAIFGLTYGLSAPLIALDLAKAGYGETAIGANAAMHALGVLLIAPFLPRLAFAWGGRRLAITALLAAAVLLAAFPAAPTLWLWFPLRIALGAASETLFVISETWLNQLAAERSRARTMAVYTAALSSGFALGPLIIVAVGGEGPWAFLIGAGLSLGACLLTLLAGAKSPPMERPGPVTTMRYLRLAPVAIAAVALNAALETAGLGLLALYAIGLGWSEDPATLLISTLMIGAILLQLPIGWLGDRMDRTRLVIILAALSTAGALIWPVALGEAWLAYPLLFLWGGAFAGIYTIMLTLVGERFRDAELVGIYAVMSVAWGLGALVGPGLGGVAMEITLHGLPMFAALLCGGFTLFAVLRARAERM
jgi:MFS family permease